MMQLFLTLVQISIIIIFAVIIQIKVNDKEMLKKKINEQKLEYEHIILGKEQECEANIASMYMRKCEEEQMPAGGGMNLTFGR